jgi:hypothetical protein
VYEILEHAPMTAEKSALYRRTLTALVSAKLVRKTEDGGHELVTPGLGAPLPRAESNPPPPPASITPPTPELITVSVRLPADVVTVLDSMGSTRSDAVRTLLTRALGSGTRRRVAS